MRQSLWAVRPTASPVGDDASSLAITRRCRRSAQCRRRASSRCCRATDTRYRRRTGHRRPQAHRSSLRGRSPRLVRRREFVSQLQSSHRAFWRPRRGRRARSVCWGIAITMPGAISPYTSSTSEYWRFFVPVCDRETHLLDHLEPIRVALGDVLECVPCHTADSAGRATARKPVRLPPISAGDHRATCPGGGGSDRSWGQRLALGGGVDGPSGVACDAPGFACVCG